MQIKVKPVTLKLILMMFLEFAVWGAYLTSLGRYLFSIGLGNQIKLFFAMQGIVSIFMPTLMGILADKKMEAQKVLSLCHGLAGRKMPQRSVLSGKRHRRLLCMRPAGNL